MRAADPATTLEILARAVAARPDALALACGDVRLTYAEYARAVAGFAADLSGHGVAGRPVAIVLRNGVEIAVAIFAAQAAGAMSATHNPDYTARELGAMLADAAPPVVVTHDDLLPLVRAAGFAGIVETVGAGWLDRCADRAGLPLAPPDPNSIAVLQFTGGTTGRAKGVLLTHRAVAGNVAQREAVLPTVFGDERVICAMPLFHSFAAAMGLHLAAHAEGSLHILPRYRPDWLVDCIAREGITRLPAGPTIFASLLGFEGLARDRLTSLRCAYSGSAPLPAATLARWEATTGVPIYEGYGQSEAGPVLTYHRPGMALKAGSVGPPLPGTELRIVDPVTAVPVPSGASGEIVARGPQVMRGYLGDPAATAEALRGGWLHTGDIGRLDADGYLFVEDRKKDMAIVGGYNVYPREVDEVMMACPGIDEAAAVGVPDPYRGEVICAFYTGDASPDALAAHLAANLVKYKRPERLRALPALPRTAVGKVDKVALRALAAE